MNIAFSEKIKTLEELGALLMPLKEQGKRIVHCHGVFDLMHPGHVKHFWAAREKGDVLVVTITCDAHVNKGPSRPVFNERLRAETIASLTPVDFVAVNYALTGVPAISALRPHIYFKGGEYRESAQTPNHSMREEADFVRSYGGEVAFTDEEVFSSSELLNEFFEPYPAQTQDFLRTFRTRYRFEDLKSLFESIRDMRVLMIGEAVIDEYEYVLPMGRPPKEAIIATRSVEEESFAGGVLACANHLAGFCNQVDMVTVLGGERSREDFIRKQLKSNVRPTFFYNPGVPTIHKHRFVDKAFLTKLFEVYHFNDRPLPPSVEDQLESFLAPRLSQYDLVLVLDYDHGFFSSRLRRLLTEHSPYLALNTQANAGNFGFHHITKYTKASYVCIDHLEARLAMRQKELSRELWPNAVRRLAEHLKAHKFVVTRGHEGCLAYGEDGVFEVPVLSKKIVDRVGAGDAFFAITAPLAAKNVSSEVIGFVGNVVGAIAVTIVGNRSAVEPGQLFRSMEIMLK